MPRKIEPTRINVNPVKSLKETIHDFEMQEAAAQAEIREAEVELQRARERALRVTQIREHLTNVAEQVQAHPAFKTKALPNGDDPEEGWKQRNPGWYGAGLHARAREVIVHYGNNPMTLQEIWSFLLRLPMMAGLHIETLRHALDANCKSTTPQLVKVSESGQHPVYGIYGIHTKPKGVRGVKRLTTGG